MRDQKLPHATLEMLLGQGTESPLETGCAFRDRETSLAGSW